MKTILVRGGGRLVGRIPVAGAKNAALPLLAATLLTEEPCTLEGIPRLTDVETMLALLEALGCTARWDGTGSLTLQAANEDLCTAPYELVRRMRASFCVLGPLVAKRRRARVSLPGGCKLGPRPVELHLKGLEALGVRVPVRHGYVEAEVEHLRGREIYLGGAHGSTVLGTANVLMAAVLAEGRTVLHGAALEPEVQDLVRFLVCMGARIHGIGTPRLEIQGVERLRGARYRILPDRIEAGTYLVGAALTRGDVTVDGVHTDHLAAVLDYLESLGAEVEVDPPRRRCRVRAAGALRPRDLHCLPYPGVPTDLQAPLMALLTTAAGTSVVHDRVFPERFMHVDELNRMGARIRKEGHGAAVVDGGHPLSGAPVTASDLRAGAALVLAGLAARGRTEVHGAEHIDRGYEGFVAKLRALGAEVEAVGEA